MKLTSLALAAGIAALSASTAFAEDTIKIGVPVGLSGANSVVAPSVVQSSELAVEEINAKGGILGKKVELVVADDGSGAVGAQKAFDSLIFDKGVNVLISMETSAARNAALPIVTRGKVPYIYTSFYEGHSCNKWMYVNAWVPEQLSSALVDYLAQEKQAKTFFLIGSDFAFGRGVLDYTKKYIEKTGGKVVGEEYLPMDGSDWTAIISALRSANPDALISCTAGGAPNVSLGKQLKSAGVNIPYGNMAVDEGTAKDMGSAAAGMYVSGSYMTSIDTPENKKFLADMKAKFGDELKTPNDLSVPQYDGIYAYKAAVEKAGSTDPKAVIKALGEISVTGPRGTIKMDPVSRHAPLTMYLAQVQDDGSLKVLKTFENVSEGKQCSFK
ncbi:MAG: substrate-binding protein [Succinivibrio sp.]|nr:substrate-binding protein [Succinivibrio sp.]